MPKEKMEEETYSLIFKSLKHPIRRKILRILVGKQLAFSEVLNILSIDSGHLSYHIENLGELVKHSANGKYELSSIGTAAVNLMSGVEERPQLLAPTAKLRGKKVRNVLMGTVLAILIISAALNIYYYNSSQALTRRVQGTTLEAARGFSFSLLYATKILESQAEPENIFALIRHLKYHITSAICFLKALRIYLLPSYEDSLLIIEDLLRNISVGGEGGVSDTFDNLMSRTGNVSLVIEAFKELSLVASEKIFEMGHEIVEAFVFFRRDHTVQTFRIIPSRLENAVLIANDLETALNEWIIKYSEI